MTAAPVLAVSGLSKKYSQSLRRGLGYALRDMAHEFLPGRSQDLRREEFWALQDVSFEVAPGDALAVIGGNGAGKSTLLKLLFGLLKPDRGEIRIAGRTEAILELGTGFGPLLSGRENIRVGAALHHMRGADLRRLEEKVIQFADIGDAIDAPVISYSTGMKARLAFALAAHLEPDILLVDEALTVGDFAFQRKCIAHIRDYLSGGGALLLVSHNAFQIQAVCNRGIYLESGRLAFEGTAVEALDRMFDARAEAVGPLRPPPDEDVPVTIEEIVAEGPGGGAPRTLEPLRIAVRYRCREAVEVNWSFGVYTSDQWVCITGSFDESPRRLEPGTGEVSCLVPRLPLLPGRYLLRVAIVDPATRYPFAMSQWNGGLPLRVEGETSATRNAQAQLQQLVALDVDWGART
jgi:lipopolysaccharide transport system ATP-binding protein